MKRKKIKLTWDKEIMPKKCKGEFSLYDKDGFIIYTGDAIFINKTTKIKT